MEEINTCYVLRVFLFVFAEVKLIVPGKDHKILSSSESLICSAVQRLT